MLLMIMPRTSRLHRVFLRCGWQDIAGSGIPTVTLRALCCVHCLVETNGAGAEQGRSFQGASHNNLRRGQSFLSVEGKGYPVEKIGAASQEECGQEKDGAAHISSEAGSKDPGRLGD